MFGWFKRWKINRKKVPITYAQSEIAQLFLDEIDEEKKKREYHYIAKNELTLYNVTLPSSEEEVDTLIDKFTEELSSLDKEVHFREDCIKALRAYRQNIWINNLDSDSSQ